MGPPAESPVHRAPVDTAPVRHASVDTASLHPVPFATPVNPARTYPAPIYPRRAGSGPKKRVAFIEEVEVEYHERSPSYDRYPYDSLKVPLGMFWAASHYGSEPLGEEKDTRYKLPRVSSEQRFELLSPLWDTVDTQTRCGWFEDSQSLESAKRSSLQSGCSCANGACDEHCECYEAGIKCCVSTNPLKQRFCACASHGYGCWNEDKSRRTVGQRVKIHRSATFIRLMKERQEEMDWQDDAQEQLTGSCALATVGQPSGSDASAFSGHHPSGSDVSVSVGELFGSHLSASVGDGSDMDLDGNPFANRLLSFFDRKRE